MEKPAAFRCSLVIVVMGLIMACDEPGSKNPTRPTVSPFQAIQVIGPDSVGPGQSAQFVANIRQLDGNTKAATAVPNLRWRSSNTSVLVVNTSGLVTAGQAGRGEAVITADIAPQGTIRGTREVVVQPEGTYRIVGQVREADAPTVPIVGARVEVVSGSNVTFTDSGGNYRLYGVPPQANIRISAAGYEVMDQSVELTANTTRNFGLNVNGTRLVLNGPYTISVDTVTPCTAMSASLQHRSYEAMLTTTGTTVDVQLTEPRFRINSTARGNRFSGRVLGGGATFTLEYYYSYYYSYYGPPGYPNLVERLGDNTFLVVEGNATTTGTAAALTGVLNGDITNWDSRFPTNPRYLGGCFGTNLQFSVTPR
jgi:Carboxypeptidase regulatory-like domain